ncbi:MAG: PD40 domain-containing protein [Myxococcales bacterium]|nr:PD40 domain-containing protein [Myxococcales bacterium]
MWAAVVAVALGADPVRHFLFGGGEHWVLTDVDGAVVKKLGKPPGDRLMQDAVVSADGKLVVFTAHDKAVNNVLLYAWNLDAGEVRRIGAKEGFHGGPAFSGDEKWVTFAHNPTGYTAKHAQVHRVRPTGEEMTLLGKDDGCHLWSASARAEGEWYVTHAEGKGTAGIERWRNGKHEQLTPATMVDGEPTLSRDGKRLLFTRIAGDGVELLELPLATGKPRALWKGERHGITFRPRFAKDEKTVLFQDGSGVYRLQQGKAEFLFWVNQP